MKRPWGPLQPLRKPLRTALERSLSGLSRFDPHERRLIFQALVVGVVVWALVYPLKLAVHGGFSGLVHAFSVAPTILLIFVPLVIGAVVVHLIAKHHPTYLTYEDGQGRFHRINAVEGDGLERAISLYFSSQPQLSGAEQGVEARWRLPTFSLAFRKMGATLATLSTGGSGGLEASVTLIGESIAAGIFKPRRRRPGHAVPVLDRLSNWWQATEIEDLQTAQLCGIAAAASTLLGTPFAAAFFAIEVMYRRQPIVNRLIYALLSSLVAFFLSHVAGTDARLFEELPPSTPAVYSTTYYAALMAVCVSIALAGIYFRNARSALDKFFHKGIVSSLKRHVLGAVGVGLVVVATHYALQFLGFDTTHLAAGPGGAVELVLGPGEHVLQLAVLGKLTAGLAVVALFAKIIATLLTITSGGSAGLLFPTIFFGTTIAVAWAHVFKLADPVVLIAPAMTASLVSIVNVPLAAILIVIELFGAQYVVPAMVALVVTALLTHHNNIYRTQQESFDARRVFPGVSIRRFVVPHAWDGVTLVTLDARRRFGVSVVGVVDRQGENAFSEDVQVNPDPSSPLQQGDVIVVLGKDEDLQKLEDSFARLPADADVAPNADVEVGETKE